MATKKGKKTKRFGLPEPRLRIMINEMDTENTNVGKPLKTKKQMYRSFTVFGIPLDKMSNAIEETIEEMVEITKYTRKSKETVEKEPEKE
jgi:hypothetical protein